MSPDPEASESSAMPTKFTPHVQHGRKHFRSRLDYAPSQDFFYHELSFRTQPVQLSYRQTGRKGLGGFRHDAREKYFLKFWR
jgi:hypothetical protein